MRYTIPNLAKNETARWKDLILNYTSLFSFQLLSDVFNDSMDSPALKRDYKYVFHFF